MRRCVFFATLLKLRAFACTKYPNDFLGITPVNCVVRLPGLGGSNFNCFKSLFKDSKDREKHFPFLLLRGTLFKKGKINCLYRISPEKKRKRIFSTHIHPQKLLPRRVGVAAASGRGGRLGDESSGSTHLLPFFRHRDTH